MGGDDNSKSIDDARDELWLKLLSIAVNVNQLLQEEIEKRAQLEEELVLENLQNMWMEMDFDWCWQKQYR